MCAIGRELMRRGHRFTLFGAAAQAQVCAANGMAFQQLGSFDPADGHRSLSNSEDGAGLRATVRYMQATAAFYSELAPKELRNAKVDFLLCDQEQPGGATAADLARIPYATICSSIPLNEDPQVPPSFVTWRPSTRPGTRLKIYLAYKVRDFVVSGVSRTLNQYRLPAGLKPYKRPGDSFSTLAQFTQLVREFDFPRNTSEPDLTYVGPYQRGSFNSVSFPYERLDGRPLIYASLGNVLGFRTSVLRQIAESCEGIPAQLVLTLGGVEPTEEHDRFPGDPIIVRYAPQRDLLARSAVAITHGGLNTVMEALGCGVPLIVLPMVGDAMGTSARVEYHGVGLSMDTKKIITQRLKAAILEVLNNPAYRQATRKIKDAISKTGGAAQVAEVVESLAQA